MFNFLLLFFSVPPLEYDSSGDSTTNNVLDDIIEDLNEVDNRDAVVIPIPQVDSPIIDESVIDLT